MVATHTHTPTHTHSKTYTHTHTLGSILLEIVIYVGMVFRVNSDVAILWNATGFMVDRRIRGIKKEKGLRTEMALLRLEPATCRVVGRRLIHYTKPGPLFTNVTNGRLASKISWSLGAARFGLKPFWSLRNLAGTSTTALPRCLSNLTAIRSLKHPILRLRDFTRSYGKTPVRLSPALLTAGLTTVCSVGIELGILRCLK